MPTVPSFRRAAAILACACIPLAAPPALHAAVPSSPATPAADLSGTVADSASGQPLPGARITVERAGKTVADLAADPFGRFLVHNLAPGRYLVRVRFLGFAPDSQSVRLENGADVALAFTLHPVPVALSAVDVKYVSPVTIDTRDGAQVYSEDQYHGSPTNTTSQILQQVITGAARAPTGEVHIRGQHAEYTYYLDGMPITQGISGSLNELFDPSIVDRITFLTGAWDAEYGNRNAAIVDVRTKVPVGSPQGSLTAYTGSYGSNGLSGNIGGSGGAWGYYVGANWQQTNMRQYPVAYDTVTYKPYNYSNQGTDAFGFGKITYTPSTRDLFYLEGNASGTNFQIPFDSATGVISDRQQDRNSFLNFGWRHITGDPSAGPDKPSGEFFGGLFYRRGSLTYTPGVNDDPSFIFYPDTTPYNLAENRNFQTIGLVADYGWRTGHALAFKVGTYLNSTTGSEHFSTVDAEGNPGPVSNSALNGGDADAYAQTVITPSEFVDFHLGVRYDNHWAPFAGRQDQWSPRIRVNFYPSSSTTVYLYYGRLFMPTNVEDLRSITSVADSNVVTAPTLPERDDFYEMGYIQRFAFGMVMKLDGYYKQSSPGIDDQTVPGSAIVTSVNIAQVRITGIEATFSVNPPGAWSGYLNFALNHAYGEGPITGGFFPVDSTGVPGNWFDLDHDQRISAVASVTYSAHRFFASATGTYGTGLTNGADITSPIGTCLTCFNSDIHVKPNFITGLSFGYNIVLGKSLLQPQVFIDNLFNSQYLLKGQFFSGASAGRPRTVQVQLSYHI
ncbi:MAG TPA: TonB-dependent receptor [Gemmatimonadaceae bacterium]|nr:TonB-dependent receptor [Gemmatimonadaceae bacterium]